jgi:hypothetical protein
MEKIRLAAILILLNLSVQAYAVQNKLTESPTPDVLERQVTNNEPYSTTLSSFIMSLVSARLPGGIVTIMHCEDRQLSHPTLFTSGTLREALQEIVRTNPEYRWQVDDGVINLLTVHDEPALLNVRISKLKVENARSINTILDELFELPEVKDAIAKLQLIPGVIFLVGPIPMDPERRPKYTVEFKDMTVREALNAIVRLHGRAAWEYKERRCDGKTVYTVDFVIQ